jgi:nicotinamidase-related amidase
MLSSCRGNFGETFRYNRKMAMQMGSVSLACDPADAARQPLAADKCALVVIDIQEKLLPPIFNRAELVRNSRLLVRLASVIGLPVVATTQYAKGLGPIVPEVDELLSALPSSLPPLDKTEFGCFGNERFCAAARALPGQRTTLLLCGMEAHICVLQTALGALNQGYLVHVAADAVGSRTEQNWRLGLDRLRSAGAVISSTEMMIYELLGGSGTPAFKLMLPHLKG